MTQVLCRLEDIEDGGAKGFALDAGTDIFIIRQRDRVFGYVNVCPHIGTPLEFLPDRFLTADRTEILCSTHGARFEITTGRCLAGPCRGRGLEPVTIRVDGDTVVADGPARKAPESRSGPCGGS